MSAPISQHQRNTVLRLWVYGRNKSQITRIVSLTWPSVHKIIREWQAGPGRCVRRIGPYGFGIEDDEEEQPKPTMDEVLADMSDMDETYIEDEIGDRHIGSIEDDDAAYG